MLERIAFLFLQWYTEKKGGSFMASDRCPGCGGVYNGKKCRICGYIPFSGNPLPDPPPQSKPKKRSHPILGFLILLCVIAALIPLLRNWGLELEAREAALSPEVTVQTIPTETDLYN
jgi:hypothetical protein